MKRFFPLAIISLAFPLLTTAQTPLRTCLSQATFQALKPIITQQLNPEVANQTHKNINAIQLTQSSNGTTQTALLNFNFTALVGQRTCLQYFHHKQHVIYPFMFPDHTANQLSQHLNTYLSTNLKGSNTGNAVTIQTAYQNPSRCLQSFNVTVRLMNQANTSATFGNCTIPAVNAS